jgi:hypothetical protein
MAFNKLLHDHVQKRMVQEIGEKVAEVLLKHGACTVQLENEWHHDPAIQGNRGVLTAMFWKPGPMDLFHEPDWPAEQPNV